MNEPTKCTVEYVDFSGEIGDWDYVPILRQVADYIEANKIQELDIHGIYSFESDCGVGIGLYVSKRE